MGNLRAHRSVLSAVIAVVLLVVVLTAAAGWQVAGGRWFVVRTPSMGQAAPVGTLLLTLPTTVGAVRVGDTVTFHAPGSGSVYTHRVISTSSAGLATQGDVNTQADPWVVTNRDMIGKVEHRWWGMGWVLRGLPLLLLLLGVVWLFSALCDRWWRGPLRLAGSMVGLAVVLAVLQPWVGAQKIDVTGTPRSATVRAVSTGVLPIRLTEGSSRTERMVSGQVGSLQVGSPSSNGRYEITPHLDLSTGWWVLLISLCLSPLGMALLVAARMQEPQEQLA